VEEPSARQGEGYVVAEVRVFWFCLQWDQYFTMVVDRQRSPIHHPNPTGKDLLI